MAEHEHGLRLGSQQGATRVDSWLTENSYQLPIFVLHPQERKKERRKENHEISLYRSVGSYSGWSWHQLSAWVPSSQHHGFLDELECIYTKTE